MIAVAQSFFAPSSVARGAFGSIASEKTPALEQTSSAIRPSFDRKCLCTVASGSLYTCRASSGSRIAPRLAVRVRRADAVELRHLLRRRRVEELQVDELALHRAHLRLPPRRRLEVAVGRALDLDDRVRLQVGRAHRRRVHRHLADRRERQPRLLLVEASVFDSNWISALPLPSSTSRSARAVEAVLLVVFDLQTGREKLLRRCGELESSRGEGGKGRGRRSARRASVRHERAHGGAAGSAHLNHTAALV